MPLGRFLLVAAVDLSSLIDRALVLAVASDFRGSGGIEPDRFFLAIVAVGRVGSIGTSASDSSSDGSTAVSSSPSSSASSSQ